jgi:hypothetical protein
MITTFGRGDCADASGDTNAAITRLPMTAPRHVEPDTPRLLFVVLRVDYLVCAKETSDVAAYGAVRKSVRRVRTGAARRDGDSADAA